MTSDLVQMWPTVLYSFAHLQFYNSMNAYSDICMHAGYLPYWIYSGNTTTTDLVWKQHWLKQDYYDESTCMPEWLCEAGPVHCGALS